MKNKKNMAGILGISVLAVLTLFLATAILADEKNLIGKVKYGR